MSFDKQHVMGAAASERAAAIKYIDGNFGLLSGMTSATDRMIQCYIAGALEASSRQEERLASAVKDFRWRANQCRTNLDAYDSSAAAIWDLAADALEGK